MRRRVLQWLLVALTVSVAGFFIVGYKNATADPLVRQLVLHLADYPVSVAPIRIVLIADLHVHGPDMPPSRVSRIVGQINALQPDIVVAAGDFVGDNWIGHQFTAAEAVAPLSRLKARFGVYAVLGNNDYDFGARAVTRALRAGGIRVLVNQAVRIGPIVLGGMDGRIFRGRAAWDARRKLTYKVINSSPGVRVLAVHRSDEFKWAPRSISLVLAGHTHCGQIVLPVIGPLKTGSDFGRKYLCGIIRNGPNTLVVTAGLGTSHLPLRIGAPPDIWLISMDSRSH